MRYFIDCEFNGHGGQLLSMALIREDGRSIYLCIADKPEDLSSWVLMNVWPLVHIQLPVGHTVAYVNDWGSLLRDFVGSDQHPIIIADSPVDIGRFCTVLSTSPDGEWVSTDYPAIGFEVHNVDCYPTTLEGAVQHNAWWDAQALRHLLMETCQGTDCPISEDSDDRPEWEIRTGFREEDFA